MICRQGLLFGAFVASRSTMPIPYSPNRRRPSMRMAGANRINLAVYDAGSGPVLVLLHGFQRMRACYGPSVFADTMSSDHRSKKFTQLREIGF
jgi:hypothetical protein